MDIQLAAKKRKRRKTIRRLRPREIGYAFHRASRLHGLGKGKGWGSGRDRGQKTEVRGQKKIESRGLMSEDRGQKGKGWGDGEEIG